MAISTPASGELRLALDEILVRENVRDLDDAHVDNLAQSIALRGLLVPLIVRPTDAGYELVAGYHRLAACRKLELPDAPVVVREQEGSSADAAAENVTRKQLTPLEEAKAVRAISEVSDIACYAKSGVIRSRGGPLRLCHQHERRASHNYVAGRRQAWLADCVRNEDVRWEPRRD
jgi:hypothetical protein